MILNAFDFAFTIAYATMSICKLGTVTTLVFAINFLTLLRLMVANFKHSINLREKYKKVYLEKM